MCLYVCEGDEVRGRMEQTLDLHYLYKFENNLIFNEQPVMPGLYKMRYNYDLRSNHQATQP